VACNLNSSWCFFWMVNEASPGWCISASVSGQLWVQCQLLISPKISLLPAGSSTPRGGWEIVNSSVHGRRGKSESWSLCGRTQKPLPRITRSWT
jgi:hypothetical protein